MTIHYTHAITRKPGPDFALGITTSDLGEPDYARMLVQHAAYVETLRALGLDVTVLDPLAGYPDAYFVEDPAVVTPDLAVITHPGAVPRRGEPDAIAPVLARFLRTARIQPPATLEGGDVLIVEKRVFVGISERTNRAGAEQLGSLLAPFGYTLTAIPVAAGLHFKSSVNYAGKNTLLVTEDFAALPELDEYARIIVDAGEAYAANTLWINDALITPSGFPRLRKKLDALGLPVIELDVSEAQKMDGGLTCMSLRF